MKMGMLLFGIFLFVGCSSDYVVILDEYSGSEPVVLSKSIDNEIVKGFKIEKKANDTLITCFKDDCQIWLKGLTGYHGKITFDDVDLEVGEAKVTIKNDMVKVNGPGYSMEYELNEFTSGKALVFTPIKGIKVMDKI